MSKLPSQQEAHFLRAARQVIGLSIQEAAQLVHASRRSWEGWERGSRPIPRSQLELFKAKISGKAGRGKLVLVLRRVGEWEEPIDAVAAENFVGWADLGNGEALIKSLAIDPSTKRPYVHKTKFKCADNMHVVRAVTTWKSVVDAA